MQGSELAEKLKRDFQGFTPAGKRIATYLLDNLAQLPYETANGIATRTGIAGITVGRFLRQLGFRNLEELKKDLRGGRPWLMPAQPCWPNWPSPSPLCARCSCSRQTSCWSRPAPRHRLTPCPQPSRFC